MLINHTHERLVTLGLAGMAKAFDDQQRQPDVTALTFEQRLDLMIDREATERENKRLVVRLKFASLRQAAIVEDVPRLFEALALARGDGRYARLLRMLRGSTCSSSTTGASPRSPATSQSKTANTYVIEITM
jgi:hypothetical protein